MRISMPFYENVGLNCGPVALKMVFEYFGEKEDLETIQNLCDPEKTGMTWTPALALAAAKLGFKVESYTAHLGYNPQHTETSFYQKFADLTSTEAKLAHIHEQNRTHGVNEAERTFDLDELLTKMNEDCIPIILLDWNRITKKEGYNGHFVPIVGYDEESIYVHDSGPREPTPCYSIARSEFDIARKAAGTDEDIIFIHRKR